MQHPVQMVDFSRQNVHTLREIHNSVWSLQSEAQLEFYILKSSLDFQPLYKMKQNLLFYYEVHPMAHIKAHKVLHAVNSK